MPGADYDWAWRCRRPCRPQGDRGRRDRSGRFVRGATPLAELLRLTAKPFVPDAQDIDVETGSRDARDPRPSSPVSFVHRVGRELPTSATCRDRSPPDSRRAGYAVTIRSWRAGRRGDGGVSGAVSVTVQFLAAPSACRAGARSVDVRRVGRPYRRVSRGGRWSDDGPTLRRTPQLLHSTGGGPGFRKETNGAGSEVW